MNLPGTSQGNWEWRLACSWCPGRAARLGELTRTYGRGAR
jgi:4-alpha-glucanotransferase